MKTEPHPKPKLSPSRKEYQYAQSFRLEEATLNNLAFTQRLINEMGPVGFSRSVILRTAIQHLADSLRRAQRAHNHHALEQFRRMAWEHSSKQPFKRQRKAQHE